MSGFQIASLIVLGLLFVATTAPAIRGGGARRTGLAWSVVWLVAAAAIAWPESTALVAHVLGIGRGADFVLYCFVVIVLVGFFATYMRLRRLETHITLLTRQLALRNPLWPDASQGPRTED